MNTSRNRGDRGWIQMAVLGTPSTSIAEATDRARARIRVENEQRPEPWTQLSLRPAGA